MAGESRTALADRASSVGAPSLADPAALADRLRLGLVRLSRQLRRQDPPGLSVTLYSALATVADRGELAIGELAESEGVPSSAATRIADRLEEAGYVARRPNPRDRRGVNVVITTAGRRRVERRRKRGNAWLAARLAGLTPGQRQALADALDVLDAVMAGAEESAVPEAAATEAAATEAAAAAREETR